VSGVAIASSRAIGPDGYQDNGSAVPLLIAGMFLTATAALLMATERTPQRTAAVMVGGSLLMVLSWPILIVGFFAYIGATIALGAQLLARGQLAGLALIAIGLILPSFNTETDWALAAVPVGIFWIAFGAAMWRSGTPLTTTVAARGVGG
ncbi:MAG TPA: hypothetical protein VHM48_01835, partial [Candidatus Limnocylindrales bacterium]|nr:hypothetical protein [Candidatus Limnocylindrales bacterium]